MKVFATVLVFAATTIAMSHSGDGVGGGNTEIRFPVDHKTTVGQAEAKCGDDANLSCCNKATYTRDITTANTDPLPGVVQTALGGGPGSDGLGLFGQCNDITARVPVLNVVGGGIEQPVERKCKQNIACCQRPPSEGDGNYVGAIVPCVALGSLI